MLIAGFDVKLGSQKHVFFLQRIMNMCKRNEFARHQKKDPKKMRKMENNMPCTQIGVSGCLQLRVSPAS
jgi:hypothetical protein